MPLNFLCNPPIVLCIKFLDTWCVMINYCFQGCVYVKCGSPDGAGRAYKALHGWWFDGIK